MNERIRLLAEQAGWDRYEALDERNQKFAELIVRECVDVVSKIPTIDNGHPHPAWKIKQHFGIES
jgi:hypothetical protein